MSEQQLTMSEEMQQLNQVYTNLCTQLGDLTYKCEFLRDQIRQVQAQFQAAAVKAQPAQGSVPNGPVVTTAAS